MAYGDFKNIKRRTASDTILRDKAFNFAKNPKYDGYQRGLASMLYKFFDNKSLGSGRPSSFVSLIFNNVTKQNLQLAENCTNQLLKNLEKEKFILDLKIIFGVLI